MDASTGEEDDDDEEDAADVSRTEGDAKVDSAAEWDSDASTSHGRSPSSAARSSRSRLSFFSIAVVAAALSVSIFAVLATIYTVRAWTRRGL